MLLDTKGVRMVICVIHTYSFSSIKLGTVSCMFHTLHLYVGGHYSKAQQFMKGTTEWEWMEDV